jgi:hypothetical protein
MTPGSSCPTTTELVAATGRFYPGGLAEGETARGAQVAATISAERAGGQSSAPAAPNNNRGY